MHMYYMLSNIDFIHQVYLMDATISASSTCVNALRWQNNEAGTRNQRCTWIHNAWFKGSICCMNHPWNQLWKATLKAFHQHSQDSKPCKNPWTRHAFTSASQANGQQPTANNCPFPSKTCKLTCNVMSKNKAPMHALLLTLLVGMAPHFYCLNIWPPRLIMQGKTRSNYPTRPCFL